MINSAPAPYIGRLRVPGYLILGLAFCLPLIDFIMAVWPMNPGLLQWRFGAMGILATSISAPLLVLMFIYAFALAAGDRKVIVLCAVISISLAVILAGSAGSFLLDMLQMKRRVPASAAAKFNIVTMQATLKFAVASLASLILFVSILRTLKMSRVVPGEKEARAGSLLVGMKPEPKRASTQAPAQDPGAAAVESAEFSSDDSSVDAVPPSTLPPRTPTKSSARPPSVGMAPPPPPPRRPE